MIGELTASIKLIARKKLACKFAALCFTFIFFSYLTWSLNCLSIYMPTFPFVPRFHKLQPRMKSCQRCGKWCYPPSRQIGNGLEIIKLLLAPDSVTNWQCMVVFIVNQGMRAFSVGVSKVRRIVLDYISVDFHSSRLHDSIDIPLQTPRRGLPEFNFYWQPWRW